MITLTILLIIALICVLVGCLMGLFSLLGVLVSLAVGVLVGALAGYVAGRFMGTETSFSRNILMGVLGSFVGEFVFGLFGMPPAASPRSPSRWWVPASASGSARNFSADRLFPCRPCEIFRRAVFIFTFSGQRFLRPPPAPEIQP